MVMMVIDAVLGSIRLQDVARMSVNTCPVMVYRIVSQSLMGGLRKVFAIFSCGVLDSLTDLCKRVLCHNWTSDCHCQKARGHCKSAYYLFSHLNSPCRTAEVPASITLFPVDHNNQTFRESFFSLMSAGISW